MTKTPILNGIGNQERKLIELTEYQAKFLDHLLYKEQSYKRKRGIKWIDAVYRDHGCTGYDNFVGRLKDTIVDQMGIEYSDEQQEEMNRTQGD